MITQPNAHSGRGSKTSGQINDILAAKLQVNTAFAVVFRF